MAKNGKTKTAPANRLPAEAVAPEPRRITDRELHELRQLVHTRDRARSCYQAAEAQLDVALRDLAAAYGLVGRPHQFMLDGMIQENPA